MNERIKELAEQAGFFGCMDEGAGLVFRKYAELIVEECAEHLEFEYGQSALTGNAAAKSIKQHFGVEE